MPKQLARMTKSLKKVISQKKPPRMTADEKRIAREMHFDRGMPPVGVAKASNAPNWIESNRMIDRIKSQIKSQTKRHTAPNLIRIRIQSSEPD